MAMEMETDHSDVILLQSDSDMPGGQSKKANIALKHFSACLTLYLSVFPQACWDKKTRLFEAQRKDIRTHYAQVYIQKSWQITSNINNTAFFFIKNSS